MTTSYSHKKYKNATDIDTLCFNMNVYENDLSKLFYNIISNIRTNFDVDITLFNKNKYLKNYTNINHNNNILHVHFEYKNILFEFKLVRQEKIYSLGYIQVKLKIFIQKNDNTNKDIFYKFCSDCVTSFTSNL